uniref:Glutathione S-transferase 1 n=1 Tax=Ciona intestinalis TaxID=7719 RepID=F7B3N6_CIOIN|nr:glutathione S-transferase 1 [Ciona intestinalis]|eukprot:XP_002121877.1 glutathione S-transferase 1 [Ciona intestinalis]
MVITLYHAKISPPSRGVLMTIRALGLNCEIKEISLFTGEQYGDEYKKINPRSKVPALVDGDITVCESRAIACYLCNKYAKGDKASLYPSDANARAIVDMQLYAGEWAAQNYLTYLNPAGVFRRGEKPKYETEPQVKDSLTYTENLLKKHKFIAGDNLTIADFFSFTDVLFLDLVNFSLDDFPLVKAWMQNIKSLLYTSEVNDEGLKLGKDGFEAKLNPPKETGF